MTITLEGTPALQAFLDRFTQDEQSQLLKMRSAILEALPEGYEELMSYGMLCYAIPLSVYPKGYLGDPKQPIVYLGITKQKHHYAFYSMGLNQIQALFEEEKRRYEDKHGKLDHGVGCLRFKKAEKVDLDLIKNITQAVPMHRYLEAYIRLKEKP